jgi:DNA-binding transcriptional LysR family regulator
MDKLRCIEIFAEVARRGSFASAAQRYSISRSAITKHVAWLENHYGTRLLARTTKEVTLTDTGRQVLQSCVPLMERFDEAETEIRRSVSSARGMVRIGMPPSFGTRHMLPVVLQFLASHPDIEVELDIDDTRGSLVSERFDASVRIAPRLEDASYVAQSLLKAPQVLVGAPSYLHRAGMPTGLADLARHECLVNTQKNPTGMWRFMEDSREIPVRVRGGLRSSYGEALQQACVLGRGLSIHPHYMVEDDLAAGRLIKVLPQTPPISLDIYLIYAARENVPTRVRAFLEFLRKWAQKPPPWAQAV